MTPQDALAGLGYDNPDQKIREIRVQKVVDIVLNAVANAMGQAEAMKFMPQPTGVVTPTAATPSGQTPAEQVTEPVPQQPVGNPAQQQAQVATAPQALAPR